VSAVTIPRRLRPVLVAALAVLALAGCQTDPGTAAYIGGEQITSAQVEGAVAANGATASRRDATLNSLNVLIQTALLRTVARDLGADVDRSVLDKAREDPDIRAQAAQFGVRPEAFGTFAGYLLTVQQHLARGQAADGQLTQAQLAALQQHLAALRAEAAKERGVRINPRYGAFDPQRAAVTPTVEPGIELVSKQSVPGQP
jgi:hypothetical protein